MNFRRFRGQDVSRLLPPCEPLCRAVPPCRTGLDPPNIKISDSGGLDLEAWCLDAWMLAGLEWIGGGDGGDGILGRGDWKKFPHARASGARRILAGGRVPAASGTTSPGYNSQMARACA
jgi:hypothetical protein